MSTATVASIVSPSTPAAPQSEPRVEIPAVATPSAAATGDVASRDDALSAEREMLDVARTALGRGDGKHALEAVDRHTRVFPRGQMSEEREAIAVQALAMLGRTDEASARGTRFRKRYPNSVLIPVIDAALDVGR
jgi:hypothetical protein